MNKINHFYHVYAGGKWREPVEEHIHALYQSGIAKHLDAMYVGYVGSKEQIEEAEEFINKRYTTVTIARSEYGWEQETMKHIQRIANTGTVLYAHTKGSSDPSPINVAWRRSMTKDCVLDWRKCLIHLFDYDTVGSHWLQSEDGKCFYGGTFWWANVNYLQTLPPVMFENRFCAENWIGLNPNIRPYDMKEKIHPGQIPLDTDWRNMNALETVYKKYSYPGGWGDKGTAHNYLPTYQKYMAQTRDITLLEIGVMRGHSIKMWNEYFTDSRIIGIDISLSNVEFPDLLNVYVCDGTKTESVDAMFPNVTFDYVVDDGSHMVEDQLASLDVFLPRMNKGGVYFIEDIAGDEPLAKIENRLAGYDYIVVDGRGPEMPPDEIMVVINC
jgi:hypothetical protein